MRKEFTAAVIFTTASPFKLTSVSTCEREGTQNTVSSKEYCPIAEFILVLKPEVPTEESKDVLNR